MDLSTWIASFAQPRGSAGPSVTLTMAPASFVTNETAMRNGLAGSTYTAAYVLLDDAEYVYFVHDGQGYDPGQSVAELSGLTGYACTIAAGNRSPAQMGAHMAAVSISGRPITDNADGTVTIGGTTAATFGAACASRSSGSGIAGIRNDSIVTADGGAGALALAWYSPFIMPGSGTKRVRAIQVWIESADASDDPRMAIYATSGGTPAALVWDAGQIDASTVSAPGWYTVWLGPEDDLTLTGGVTYAAALKSSTNLTQFRFVSNVSEGNRGDFTSAQMAPSDGTVSNDEAVAWPATWTGGFGGTFAVCFPIRVLYEDDATPRGDASWGSATNWYGAQAAAASSHTTETDINGIFVAMRILVPDVLGRRIGDARIGIGTVNGGNFRIEAWSGGTDDASAPHNPSADGATLLHDYGQPSDTITTNDYVTLAGAAGGVALESDVFWLSMKGNSTSDVLFDYQAVNWLQTTDDRDNRADFYPPTAPAVAGSEWEIQDGTWVDFAPGTPSTSPIDAGDATETWPSNNPALSVGVFVPGMAA